ELGEIVSGARPGRANDREITLYKSVGVAVEDAAAAALVLKLARERGVERETGAEVRQRAAEVLGRPRARRTVARGVRLLVEPGGLQVAGAGGCARRRS